MSEIRDSGSDGVDGSEIQNSEVKETSPAETGGESSAATKEAAEEQANESGGFDENDEDTIEDEDDEGTIENESSQEAQLEEKADDSQSVGFDEVEDNSNDELERNGGDGDNGNNHEDSDKGDNGDDRYEKPGVADRVKDFFQGKESAYDAERAEKAGIKGAFDELPRERREAVYETFENAPDEIKNTVNDLSGELSVEDTKGNDCCHYDPTAEKIRMERDMDNAEYAEVFSHEYGHFVDDKKGDVSNTPEFKAAMNKDLASFDKSTEIGRDNFDTMMDDLMKSDASYDRAVSDNLSAFFKNDPEIIQRYHEEGASYYQHSDAYWSKQGNREAEIYANSFSMCAQDNKASCEFMEKYFPNTWQEFKNTL